MAAAGMSWLAVGAIFLIYLLGKELYGREVGLLAAFLYGFSYDLVVFSRWLANPNPLPFFTLLVLLCLYLFIKGKDKALIAAAFFIGLCLQIEAASAIWFLPAAIVILIWQRRIFKNPRILFLAFLAFFITLLPQIVFDFRHQGVLRAAFRRFLVGERSFSLSLVQTLRLRLLTYYDVFFGKFSFGQKWVKAGLLALFSATLFFFRKKVFNQGGKLLLIWLFSPVLGFLFYRGNHGYVWDYYFTGVIPAFIILLAAGLKSLAERKLIPRVLLGIFLILFAFGNLRFIRNYLKTGIGITLKAQIWTIDWIYEDAKSEEFNIDAYVPPQIFYSYSYLFRWYGQAKYGREPKTALVKNLYTLYEPDGEHPQFLGNWLKRQNTIGRIIKSDFWGDITVQKRERIKFND
jgi:4-amino-4-deoxy-L-arabinose transferase-like glycosyltransferase